MRRDVIRTVQVLPLRKPTLRYPKVHPTTGLPVSRRKGQHLIHNKGVIHKMLEAADIRSMDSVYEVGCGTGEITMGLLPLARRVYTIDLEPRMVDETQRRAEQAGFGNLEAKVGDVLKAPWPRRFDVCVSNLPFQISPAFVFRLMRRLSEASPWRSAVLLVQQDFAERLLADPGEKPFSRLAVNVRLFAQAQRLFDVKAGSFAPQPEVNSTVLQLTPRVPPPAVDFAEWDALIRLIFSRRRKTLRAQFGKLSTMIMLEQNHKMRCSLMGERPFKGPFPDLVMEVLKEEGVLKERAVAMDLHDLHSLLRAFHRKGIYFASLQGNLGESSALGDWDDVEGDSDEDLADDPHSIRNDGLEPRGYFSSSHQNRVGVRAPKPGLARAQFRASEFSYP